MGNVYRATRGPVEDVKGQVRPQKLRCIPQRNKRSSHVGSSCSCVDPAGGGMKCKYQGDTAGSDKPGLTARLANLWSPPPGEQILRRLLLLKPQLVQILLCRLIRLLRLLQLSLREVLRLLLLLLLRNKLLLLLLLLRKISRWRLLLVTLLLSRLLAASTVVLTETSIAVPTSAAMAVSTPPASPAPIAPRP